MNTTTKQNGHWLAYGLSLLLTLACVMSAKAQLVPIPSPAGYEGATYGYQGNASAKTIAVGTTLYTQYQDNDGNYDLAKYDGTTLTIIPSPTGYESAYRGYVGSPIAIGSTLYMRYQSNSGTSNLAKYDGTTLTMIPNPTGYETGTGYGGGNIVVIGSTLYMQYRTNTGNYDLAKYDGATLTMIPSPAGYNDNYRGCSGSFAVIGTTLYTGYFSNDDKFNLAKYDGTTLTIVPNLAGYDNAYAGYGGNAIVVGTTLYMAYAGNDNNYDLAKYDGTTLTVIPSPTGYDGLYAGYNTYPIAVGSTLYMRYIGNDGSFDLAKYDGTTLTVIPSPTEYDGNGNGFYDSPIAIGTTLYIRYRENNGNYDLAKYDGTTLTIINSPAGYDGSYYYGYHGYPVVIGTTLYMRYGENGDNYDLAKYDGTTLTIIPSPTGYENGDYCGCVGYLDNPTVIGTTLYMRYGGNNYNSDLAIYDGTNLTIVPSPVGYENNPYGQYPDSFTALSTTLYMRYRGNDNNFDLVKYNAPLPLPEINLQSNNISIADGDNTPLPADNTDFWKINVGTTSARTFTIQNTGTVALNISSITSNNAKFVVSGAPTTVSAGSSATFLLTYTPNAVMVDNTTLTINSDDADEAVYDIAIQGEGLPAYAWSNVGNAGFSAGFSNYQSLAFHPTTGEPYIAYTDWTVSQKITVMRYTAGAWTIVGTVGFSAGGGFFQSLVFHPTTFEPYIAYSDGSNSYKTTVMRFTAGAWTLVGTAGFSSGTAYDQDLVFHPTTFEPYVGYRDVANSNKTTVMRFDGINWVNVGTAGFSAGGTSSVSLAMHATTGEPHIAYQDAVNSNKTTVMRFDGINWVNVGTAGFSAGTAVYQSLAINPITGEPYVAYLDATKGNKITVMRFNGTSWVNVGIEGFSVGEATEQDLIFHPITKEPYVAFRGNNGRTTAMRFNGTAWVNVGTINFSAGEAVSQSLAIHPTTGEPYVAHQEIENGNKTTVMRFSVPIPEINLQGNVQNIADGANAPTNTDHTLFIPTAVNSNSTRTYTIQNISTAVLNVTNVAISGIDASLFTVSGLPAFPFDINGNSSQTFTVTFAPTSTGTKNATITITNNDTDEASYDFAIRGVGAILNLYASPTGNDSNDGLSAGMPKLTITNAIATVEEGGTINIATGTYSETVTITKNVIFATTGTVTIQNLTINGAGKTLTLNSPLQVSRVVALQDGTIASNGNLILASHATESGLIDDFTAGYTGTITGNIQVQRYLNNTNAGTRIFSAPVSGMTASQLGSDAYSYNESILVANINGGWQSIAGSTTLVPFNGYRIQQTATGNQIYTFVGAMNTGAYTATLTRQVSTGANTAAGYTAVGNPYPSPINWVTIANLPANAGQITGVASIYKTTGLATGVWATVNSGGVGINGATRWIPSGEGFLVRRGTAGTSTYNINNTVRSNVYTNNNNFLREAEKTLVRLQMTNGTYADEIVVYAEEKATTKIDTGLDAEKLAGDIDKPYLAGIAFAKEWAINVLPTLQAGTTIPLAIRGNGTYTLQINEKTALMESVYLYDRYTNILHDLHSGYTFEAKGTENNRFVLHIGKPTELNSTGEAVRIWASEKTVYVRFADAELASQAEVIVTNVQGQTVSTYQNLQDANTQLQTTLPTGVYIVRVQTPQGVVTQKIMIE